MGDLGLYRSDIFSLGVIVYEILTGELPFKSLPRKDGVVKTYDAWQYIPARLKREDLPLWLDLALKKACSPRPTQRYQAMSEFLQDMTEPNRSLLEIHSSAPLLEKNPLRFWKLVSGILLLIVFIQFIWI